VVLAENSRIYRPADFEFLHAGVLDLEVTVARLITFLRNSLLCIPVIDAAKQLGLPAQAVKYLQLNDYFPARGRGLLVARIPHFQKLLLRNFRALHRRATTSQHEPHGEYRHLHQ
jgi:hypothetical protein